MRGDSAVSEEPFGSRRGAKLLCAPPAGRCAAVPEAGAGERERAVGAGARRAVRGGRHLPVALAWRQESGFSPTVQQTLGVY